MKNLTTGESPALLGSPGDRLRYTLYVRTLDAPLINGRVVDDLGSLNTLAVFEPGSLALVGGLPPGADASNTDPAGGTNEAGLLDISGLDLPIDADLSLQFDITLAAAIPNGTVVTNQAAVRRRDQEFLIRVRQRQPDVARSWCRARQYGEQFA